MKKKGHYKCLRVLYSIWGCITGITLITCSAIMWYHISSSKDEYEVMIDNWQKDVVTDFIILDSTIKCPTSDGYEDWLNWKPVAIKVINLYFIKKYFYLFFNY